MRSDVLTTSRRRRAAGSVLALAIGLGVALTGCGDDGEPTPAISGENPESVTVPTSPPTTTTEAPADVTTPSDDTAPAETTVTTP